MNDSDLDRISARLQILEDIEAIKQLKARYCAFCDDDYDPDGIASLFTENGTWDGGTTFGRCEGRDGIKRHFTGATKRVSIARHQVMNPIIEVDGDSATGQWYLFQPCTDAPSNTALWLAATYHDTYRRADGNWLFETVEIDVDFFTRFDRGWAEERFSER